MDEETRKLIDYVRRGNKSTEMNRLEYMEAIDTLCDKFEEFDAWSKGEHWPYKWMDEHVSEWANEVFEKECDAFVKKVTKIVDNITSEETCPHVWYDVHAGFGDPDNPTGRRCGKCQKQEFY